MNTESLLKVFPEAIPDDAPWSFFIGEIYILRKILAKSVRISGESVKIGDYLGKLTTAEMQAYKTNTLNGSTLKHILMSVPGEEVDLPCFNSTHTQEDFSIVDKLTPDVKDTKIYIDNHQSNFLNSNNFSTTSDDTEYFDFNLNKLKSIDVNSYEKFKSRLYVCERFKVRGTELDLNIQYENSKFLGFNKVINTLEDKLPELSYEKELS